MMNKLLLTACLLLALPAAASVNIDFRDGHNWKFNDLSKEAKLQSMLKGAVGTILDQNDHISTVFVYAGEIPEGTTLGQNPMPWKKLVIADALDHATIKVEKTFKVDGQWRYYIESYAKTEGDETSIATMALVKDGHVVVFTFQQDPKLFKPRIKSIRNLYFHLKVDKT